MYVFIIQDQEDQKTTATKGSNQDGSKKLASKGLLAILDQAKHEEEKGFNPDRVPPLLEHVMTHAVVVCEAGCQGARPHAD